MIMDLIIFLLALLGAMCLSFVLGIGFGYFLKEQLDSQRRWIKKRLRTLCG